MAQKKAAAIDPDRMYLIHFSKTFEHEGKKYVPRQGQKIKLRGEIVAQVQSNLDSYEAV